MKRKKRGVQSFKATWSMDLYDSCTESCNGWMARYQPWSGSRHGRWVVPKAKRIASIGRTCTANNKDYPSPIPSHPSVVGCNVHVLQQVCSQRTTVSDVIAYRDATVCRVRGSESRSRGFEPLPEARESWWCACDCEEGRWVAIKACIHIWLVFLIGMVPSHCSLET
jgi:hypothetical protein